MSEAEKIVEGLYRWTVEACNDAVKSFGGQLITGTGSAPLLKPSEAREAIETESRRAVLEAKAKWNTAQQEAFRVSNRKAVLETLDRVEKALNFNQGEKGKFWYPAQQVCDEIEAIRKELS